LYASIKLIFRCLKHKTAINNLLRALVSESWSELHGGVLAEGVGEGNAVDVTAVLAGRGLSKVEDDEEKSEENDSQDSASNLHNQFRDPVLLREIDVGQDNKGSQESEQEPSDMSEVVDPRKKSNKEKEDDEEQEFSEFHDGRLVDFPVHHDLHDQGSKDTVKGTGSTNLWLVWDEDAGQHGASNTTSHVDETNPPPASKLLHITQNSCLENQCDQHVDDSRVHEGRQEGPVELVGRVVEQETR